MAITLYVMRHGDAVMRAATDALRPLSERGEHEVCRAAQALAGLEPDYFWVSPYLRAQQTARLVKEHSRISTPVTTEPHITPDDHPAAVVQRLAELSEPKIILMVSHNPLVSALVSLLVDGHYQGGYSMGTATIACVDFDEVIGAGQGTLRWLS